MRFTSHNQGIGHIYGTKAARQTSLGATTFLSGNARMASLLPAAMRMASLQQDCAAALPPMFASCDVLSFEDAQLVLATPTSAVAAKLKQQVPKLQAALMKRGWQINAIKLKVQVTRSIAPVVHTQQLNFPPAAVSAFAELGDALPATPQNATLIAAIKAMAARRR
ncbi:MAG: DciA family protein [Pseudomonadota bacterium]|nr:DciA family protein [Pseudomonadota bacterium]